MCVRVKDELHCFLPADEGTAFQASTLLKEFSIDKLFFNCLLLSLYISFAHACKVCVDAEIHRALPCSVTDNLKDIFFSLTVQIFY